MSAPATPLPEQTASSGEQRVLETAAKTAAALGSVTSWIERAQQQLAETTRANAAAQERTAAVVNDAIGAIGERLDAIERKVEAAPAPRFDALGTVERLDPVSGDAAPRPAGADDDVRSMDDRMREMASRLEAPRSVGRRGIAPQQEVEVAVAEIRSRQAQLDSGRAASPAAPAPRTSARQDSELLSILRADMDRLAARIESSNSNMGLDGLRREIDGLHGSVAALAKRDDLEALQRGIDTLSADLAAARAAGSPVAAEGTHIESLQAQIDQLTSPAATIDLARLAHEIDVVSHKLDFVAAGGIDPTALGQLSNDIADMRSMLAEAARPLDTSGFEEQLAEIRLELARLGSQQVDPQDFTSLRIAFEDLRDSLARPQARTGGAEIGVSADDLQQVTKHELQPIASMMATLVDKIDRMERHVSEPELLEQLERQIAGLTATISDTAARDPSLGALNQAMADLTHELATWRHSTIEIAEQAARNAIAETLGSWPAEARRLDPRPPIAQAPAEGLGEVNSKLEEVVRRLGTLDDRSAGPAASERSRLLDRQPGPEGGDQPVRSGELAMRRLNDAIHLGPELSEADRPLPRAPEDEVLLEPGSARPGTQATAAHREESPRDIKASFIAAARRAAQAAATENGEAAAARPAAPPAADAPSDLSGRLRGMLDRLRRPLLVGAAALVVAIGGYRLIADMSGNRPARVATAPTSATTAPVAATVPTVVAPATPAVVIPSSDAAEPNSTQSIPARETATPAALPRETADAASAANGAATARAERITAASAATPADASQKQALQLPAGTSPSSAAPKSTTPDGASASLKQAALNGDPAALYEMAARTMEGRGGVARDPKAAVGLFEKAAEKNFAPAQYRTGNAYEKGVGVTRDAEVARRWYQRAAENGNVRAMHNLAVLMAEGSSGKPDYNGAIGWFQRAAEHGLRDSQFNLAVLFARGLGTQQDLVKSYTWFSVAAGQGDDEAGRKRDEVAARMSPADLTKAKSAAERWRATPPSPAANEVTAPAAGWSSSDASKKPFRIGRL